MTTEQLTAQRLREVLLYNQDTGVFVWRVKRGGRNPSKPTAGCKKDHGRDGGLVIRVDGRRYRASRLAWLYMTGKWPEHEVGHENGDKDDLCWRNLRDLPNVLHCENQQRASGVEYRPGCALPYRVRVSVAGRKTLIGNYATEDEAHEAYRAAKATLHPGCVHWADSASPNEKRRP